MLILLFEKHLIWSRSDGSGRTIYYYYYDQITWVVVAVAVIWIIWLLIRKYRLSRAQRRPPRGNNKRVPRQVVKIKDELCSKYLAAGFSNNLHAIGIGLGADGNYCVQLFVSDSTKELWPGADVKTLQASYGGIPLVVVQLPRANSTIADEVDLQSYQELTVGGVSGANKNLVGKKGTLGFFCQRRGYQYGPVYVLSNSHVLVERQDRDPRDTDLIDQPSPGEPAARRSIGTLYRYLALKFADPRTVVPEAGANFIDAAIARLKQSQGFQPVLPRIGAVRGYVSQEDLAVGEPVRKVGRTTGYTEGRIASVGVNLWISYGTRYAYFMDQFLIEPSWPAYQRFIRPGDSGSLVVEADNYAVGLICAEGSYDPPRTNTNGPIINHYGVANPISKVLDEFNIELVRAPELEVVAPIGFH